MKFNLYSIWMDYTFYVYTIILIAAVTALLFGIRKLMELGDSEEGAMSDDLIAGAMPPGHDSAVQPHREDQQAQYQAADQPQPQELFEMQQPARPERSYQEAGHSRAEEFLKNLYGTLANIDDRMKNIEKNLAVSRHKTAGNEFIMKFLEDIINDYDTLDREKVKARIQFLISDLRK